MSLNLKSLRQKIGYVGQEPVLFNMTVKENLLYGKPEATEDEVV
jgi:ABC-type multidrug transport system fused ATPase/permease subunit